MVSNLIFNFINRPTLALLILNAIKINGIQLDLILQNSALIITSNNLETFGGNHKNGSIWEDIAFWKTETFLFNNLLLIEILLKEQLTIHFHSKNLSEYFDIMEKLSKIYQIVVKGNNFLWSPQIFSYVDLLAFPNYTQPNEIIKQYLSSDKVNFPMDSEVYIVLLHGLEVISIWELYHFKNVLNLNQVQLNCTDNLEFWSSLNFKSIELTLFRNPISVRRQNLSQFEITAVAQNDPDYQPRIKIKTHLNGTVQFVSGMCLHVLESMQFIFNFRFTALDGRGWVGLFPNGTWTGMSGQVVNNEADISISQASTIMMTDQLQGISFLHPTSNGKLVAIFRQPPASTIRDIVKSAFDSKLWISCFVTWIVIALLLRLFYRLISALGGNYYQTDIDLAKAAGWWAISTNCGFGWHSTPQSIPIRLIFTIGFYFSSFILVAFSASLVTNLSTEQLPIRNLRDLTQNPMNIYADKWLPMAQNVLNVIYEERGKRFQMEEEKSYYAQLEDAIKLILKKSWAFITFPDAITIVFFRLNYTEVFYCNTINFVVVSKTSFANAMFVKRGSPLLEIFNPKILMMIERGFMSRLNRKYDLDTNILCVTKAHEYRGGLKIQDVTTSFLFIITGTFLSILILVVERCFKIKCSKNPTLFTDSE